MFLGLPVSTIGSIIKVYLDSGRTTKICVGGDRRSVISNDQKEMLRNCLDADPCITLEKLKSNLQKDLNINVSITTIFRCLEAFHYTFKRIILVPEKRNSQRHQYADNFLANIVTSGFIENVIFIDETGYNVSMRSKYGRCLRGTNPHVNIRALKSRNISVCAALSKSELLYFKINTNAFRSITFSEYLKELFIIIRDKQMERITFVMDNASIHKTREVTNLILENEFNIMFLPAYSPFLNPIENLFSKWKHLVRSQNPNNEAHLFELINSCASQITKQDCEGYYRHMLTYLRPCLNDEPIDA